MSFAPFRHVQHVDGRFPSVAISTRSTSHPCAEIARLIAVQQPRRVVGDDLEDGVFMRVLVVEMDDRRAARAGGGSSMLRRRAAQQRGDIDRARHDAFEHLGQLRGAGGVLLQEPFFVGELEHVEHQAVGRGHRLAAMDVHAEVRQHAGDVREQERLVQRDERQLPDVVVVLEERVDLVRLDVAREPDVAVDRAEPERATDTGAAGLRESAPARLR